MRLICPNCDAEYEVDDAAIPETGRDVQCSNCGHAWFQLPPEIELALEQEDELFGQTGASDPLPADFADDDPPPPPVAPVEPVRRNVDENLLAILREEAEREAAARRAEGAPLESQPDLGLAAPAATTGVAAAATSQRIAQMKGIDPPPPPRTGPRRDLLPDIEEINSSLKGNVALDTADTDAKGGATRARGFRSGFAFAMVIALLAAAVYTAAPRISAHLPAAEGAMTAYVASVDNARVWLDGAVLAATQIVRNLAGQGETPPEG